MLERKSASAEAARPPLLPEEDSSSFVASAIGEAMMISDWNKSAKSLCRGRGME